MSPHILPLGVQLLFLEQRGFRQQLWPNPGERPSPGHCGSRAPRGARAPGLGPSPPSWWAGDKAQTPDSHRGAGTEPGPTYPAPATGRPCAGEGGPHHAPLGPRSARKMWQKARLQAHGSVPSGFTLPPCILGLCSCCTPACNTPCSSASQASSRSHLGGGFCEAFLNTPHPRADVLHLHSTCPVQPHLNTDSPHRA